MTCRERLQLEYPERVGSSFVGGCHGCPEDYGYSVSYSDCASIDCSTCWDREAIAPIAEVNTIKNLFEELEHTIMHPNWGSWEQRVAHFEELKKKYIGE